jgi:hypothetical protein
VKQSVPFRLMGYPEVEPQLAISDGMRRPVSGGDALSSQVIDALEAHEIRRPAMRRPSTTALCRRRKLHDGQLTVGLDLGDRSNF